MSVILAAVVVSGPALRVPPGEDWWGHEFCRSHQFRWFASAERTLFTVALSDWSRVVGLLVSVGDVSGSLSDSITYIFFGFDGILVNRLSGPLGAVPLLLLLQSWSNSVLGLLMFFLCIILPFVVVTV